MLKQYFYITRKRLLEPGYENEKVLSRKTWGIINLLVLMLYAFFGIGMAYGMYRADAPPLAAFSIALVMAIPIDYAAKLVLVSDKTKREAIMDVLPFSKKGVLSWRYFQVLLVSHNLGLFCLMLPLMVVFWQFGALQAIAFSLFLLLYSMADSAMVSIFKNLYRRDVGVRSLSAFVLSLAMTAVSVTVVVKLFLKRDAEVSDLWLVTGILSSIAVVVLVVCNVVYVSINRYLVEKRQSTVSGSRINIGSGGVGTLLLRQAVRTQVGKSNLFVIAVVSLALPLMYSINDFNIPGMEKLAFIMFLFPFFSVMFLGDLTFSSESVFMDRLITMSPRLLYRVLVLRYRIGMVWSLFAGACLCLLPTGYSPYVFAGAAFFSAGPLMVCVLFSAAYYAKRWDTMSIEKAVLFNLFDIVSALVMAVAFALAVVIVNFGSERLMCIVFVAIGLVFIASHTFWMRLIYNKFMSKRYKLLAKYRMLKV